MNDILKHLDPVEQYNFLNQFLPLSAFPTPERKSQVIDMIMAGVPKFPL